jgi:hypothetical protein
MNPQYWLILFGVGCFLQFFAMCGAVTSLIHKAAPEVKSSTAIVLDTPRPIPLSLTETMGEELRALKAGTVRTVTITIEAPLSEDVRGEYELRYVK